MPKRKHRFVRHETAEGWVPNLNAEGANVIFRKLEAQRKASHGRLGTPEGLSIPDKLLPTSEEELRDELAVVTKEEAEVTRVVLGLSRPDGQEGEALGRRMVDLRHRRWKLTIALHVSVQQLATMKAV